MAAMMMGQRLAKSRMGHCSTPCICSRPKQGIGGKQESHRHGNA